MRYLGGKTLTAKALAHVIAPGPADRWWDPFCGGLSMSVALSKYGPGTVSDINPALIALYTGIRGGWLPPTTVTVEEWGAAKSLPDTDPLKAFIGFGCSYGGMWFSSPAVRAYRRWINKKHPCWGNEDPVGSCRRALLRDIPLLNACDIVAADFLTTEPPTGTTVIYCDPPYAGTTPYAGAGSTFDHVTFWRRCQKLAERARVYVSEYACPEWVEHEVVWSRARDIHLTRPKELAISEKQRLENLYMVKPL